MQTKRYWEKHPSICDKKSLEDDTIKLSWFYAKLRGTSTNTLKDA